MSGAFIDFGRRTLSYAVILGIVAFAIVLGIAARDTAKTQTTVNEALDGIWAMVVVCNQQGSIVYVNKRFTEYTGYTEAEIKAGGISLIVPPEQERDHAVAFAKMMLSPRYDEGIYRRIEVCRKDGGRFTAAINIRLVHAGDDVVAYAYVLPDSVMDQARNYPLMTHSD